MNVAKAWASQLDDYVIDLAWSPDSGLLAAASVAGGVTLFGADGALRHSLPGHADGANAVAFAPAGSAPSLASGGQDGAVRFWDPATGAQTAEAVLGHAWIENLAWRPAGAGSPGAVAAASGRDLVLVSPEGSSKRPFKTAPKTLSALAWHPGGGAIAAGWFGGVCVWDSDDFHAQREYGYSSAIEALVWSPDNRWLVAGAQDNAVHLWIPEEDLEFHMSGYETKVRELSFSSDSRWLATGGARDACVWDCSGAGPEGREPVALPHTGRVCATAYQRSHDLLATAAQDKEICLWLPTQRNPMVAAVKLNAPASALAWSPDDRLLAIGSQSGGVLVLKVDL